MSLLRYTQQGIEQIKEAPGRVEAARQAFRAVGAELKSFHLLMGGYDGVLFAEIP
ncbi:MAG: GYD domain-containing protein, partial [Planctomycetota bacterium]